MIHGIRIDEGVWFIPDDVTKQMILNPPAPNTLFGKPIVFENQETKHKKDTEKNGTRATPCYASGWRPEASLQQVVLDMVDHYFNETASVDACRTAASTLVEAVYPEIMPTPFDVRAANASFREWCKDRGQFP